MKKANDNYRGHRTEMVLARQLAERAVYEDRIKKENDAFAAMAPSEKRVRIAQDVLEWIALGKLTPRNGTYLRLYDDRQRDRSKSKTVNGFECHACALGSVFACAAERSAFPTDRALNYDYDSGMRARLADIFTSDQLLAIEDAFEGFLNSTISDRASVFCDDLPRIDPDVNPERTAEALVAARKRMERIMRNIIANGGEFVP